MMTIGRLRAIESYWARHFKADNVGLHELIAEVKRLREALKWIAEHRHDMHELAGHASEALREPDLGPPDIVCRRDGSSD